jgi:iron(III) transport system substrate-binding protein
MFTRRAVGLAGAAAATLATFGEVAAQPIPSNYPRSYQHLIDAARREGHLVIYTATDEQEISDVLRDFRSRHPYISVDYVRLRAAALFDRFVGEVAAGRPTADLLFSSAMDTQIKLVNDGYAQTYSSPEKPNLQPWAIWKDQAYGLTAEPVVFVYNRRLLPARSVPLSHDSLTRILNESGATFRGKVATYDPEHSATGYLFITQDVQISRDTWALVEAMGHAQAKLFTAGDEMLAEVASGKCLFAYNMLSSYAIERQEQYPVLGIVFPSDYTLVMSRIAFIAKEAAHPAAAKLFLDYILSRDGQASLARRHMASVRAGVSTPGITADPATSRAIHVGPALLANIDQVRRQKFLRKWKDAITPS